MNKKLVCEIADNSVRAENIFHLGAQCITDEFSWPSELEDLFDDYYEECFEAIGIEPPEDEDKGYIIDHLLDNEKLGFLVKFATKIPRNITDSGFSCSWGMYTTKLIYSDSFEDACRQALKWRDEYIEKKLAEAKN